MNKVKVVLANQPRMLRDSLRILLERQSDIEVVAADDFEVLELLSVIEQTTAQVVVLTLTDAGRAPGLCSHLLSEFPGLVLLAVGKEEPHLHIYRQVISKETIEDPTESSLLSAIRQCHDEASQGEKQQIRKIEKTIGRSEE